MFAGLNTVESVWKLQCFSSTMVSFCAATIGFHQPNRSCVDVYALVVVVSVDGLWNKQIAMNLDFAISVE